MDQQRDPEYAGLLWKKKCGINPEGQIGMQGVKPDTAAIRVENRICQQMVKIDQQARQQDEYRP